MEKLTRPEDNRYKAITQDICVTVTPFFLDEQSNPEKSHFVWAYEVEILNQGTSTIQLRERTWLITNERGDHEHVHGPGVVGEQPILNPGDLFRYTSGCPLNTASGFMSGSYTMTTETGERFDVEIPAFALDMPGARGRIN
ncbi:MAG: Co2+/Mg2+ efflux protein ApaG [Rhizobiaceae bacterium]